LVGRGRGDRGRPLPRRTAADARVDAPAGREATNRHVRAWMAAAHKKEARVTVLRKRTDPGLVELALVVARPRGCRGTRHAL